MSFDPEGKPACRINLKHFGAKGDGITDDTQVIQAVIYKYKGLSICIPRGEYLISQTLDIPSGADIEGVGINASIFRTPNNISFSVFKIDNQTGVRLANFSIRKKVGNPEPPDIVKIYGVEVIGSSSDILIEHILVDGCYRGFNIAGGVGDSPGLVERLTLRDCRTTHSIKPTRYTGQYGFRIDDCDEITISDCHADNHWLDGLKLRKKTRNVNIKGGSYNNNGVAITENPDCLVDKPDPTIQCLAGDGIDAYAGGDTFNITDTICENNSGNGFTIKTGPFNNVPDAADFGYVKNIALTGLRAVNNRSQGVYLTRNSAANPEQPLVSCITVLGGLFEGNGKSGLYLRGRNISVIAPLVKGNTESGILIPPASFDIDIVAAKVIANGRFEPDISPGIGISIQGGQRIQVRGGTINGKDANTIMQDGDYADLPALHDRAILIARGANHIIIDDVEVMHSKQTPEIFMKSRENGICIFNQKGEGAPDGHYYGGPGSRYLRTDGVVGEVLYIKETGFDTEGWRPFGQASVITAFNNIHGTADGTIDNVGPSFDQAVLNNNFRELSEKINDLLGALQAAQLMSSE